MSGCIERVLAIGWIPRLAEAGVRLAQVARALKDTTAVMTMKRFNDADGFRPSAMAELLAVGLIATSVIGMVAALLGVFYAPQVVFGAFAATAAYAYFFMPGRGTLASFADASLRRFDWPLLTIMLLALALRVMPFNAVIGGQDQGVYVSIANDLAANGTLEPRDPVLGGLEDRPIVEQRYVRENYVDGTFLPGVYATQDKTGDPKLEFQFYHLFPVWMALFAAIFGAVAAPFALVVFALAGTYFFYVLAGAIAGRRAGLVGAALLAVNPLHALFSRWPVTEVSSLAFALIGFAFLAAYLRADADRVVVRYLWISALAFLALFFTRISGMIYLPAVLAIGGAAASMIERKDARRALVCWVMAVSGGYALSVWYGLSWSPSYSSDVYSAIFSAALGAAWRPWVSFMAAIGLLAWCAWVAASRSNKIRPYQLKVIDGVSGLMPAALVLLVLYGALQSYRLAFTDAYAAHPWLGKLYQVADGGGGSLGASALVAVAIYAGPLAFLVSVFLSRRASRDKATSGVVMFAILALAYTGFVVKFVFFQPYYARYLLSEVVPAVLLLSVCGWALLPEGFQRRLVASLLGLSGVAALTISAGQLQVREGEDGRKVLASLSEGIGRHDLILLDAGSIGRDVVNELKTPLMFVQGVPVATITGDSLRDRAYVSALAQGKDEVYLLAHRLPGESGAPDGFIRDRIERFEAIGFRRSNWPPFTQDRRYALRLERYRLDPSFVPKDQRLLFAADSAVAGWLDDGWHRPESWGVWSSKDAATLDVDTVAIGCAAGCDLKFTMTAFLAGAGKSQHVSVYVNGAPAAELAFSESAPERSLTLSLAGAASTIEFKVASPSSPRAEGIGTDSRELGIGLKDVVVSDADRLP